MAVASPRQAAARHVAAFNARDFSGDPENLAREVEWLAPGGVSLRGRQEALDFYRVWWDAFPDAHVEIDEVAISGSTVITEATFLGTHNGVLMATGLDIEPTGNEVKIPFVSIQEVKRGQIVSNRLYLDRLELLSQMRGQKPEE